MEALTCKLEQFEGPLDLLLTLIQKNKVNIADIPISMICDQYMEYIAEANRVDMEIAAEFMVMASELMLIKSKMLLPRVEDDEEDPRKELADALARYQQAKTAASILAPAYEIYIGRLVKDSDEISIDKTFVLPQSPEKLYAAIKRIISYNAAMEDAKEHAFTPMIKKPVVSVKLKIAGIINKLKKGSRLSHGELLCDSESLPDLIAAFIGILERIKTHHIIMEENEYDINSVHGNDTVFTLNTDESTIIKEETTEIIV
jgi:segregation and condensation protein A